MKPSKLRSLLSSLDTFEKPKILFEQYATDAEMAAEMMTLINDECQLDGSTVLDLGCGCGILGIAASLIGASYTLGVEIDPDAVQLCKENIKEAEVDCIMDIVLADALTLSLPLSFFDVAIINPPFGTKKNQGIDIEFVRRALCMVREDGRVYSLHKTSTRNFILKKGKEMGAETRIAAQLRWNLNSTYRFHNKKSVDIEVDLVCFHKKSVM